MSNDKGMAAAVARAAGGKLPFEGAIEEPGQGVRTFIDGEENWVPFGERGHFIIAQEIPENADSMQLAQKEEEPRK